MKTFYRSILGVLLIGSFFVLVLIIYKRKSFRKYRKKMTGLLKKRVSLTENEKKLKQESQTKEWEEVDKQTDK